jgi:hypothetical protein
MRCSLKIYAADARRIRGGHNQGFRKIQYWLPKPWGEDFTDRDRPQ